MCQIEGFNRPISRSSFPARGPSLILMGASRVKKEFAGTLLTSFGMMGIGSFQPGAARIHHRRHKPVPGSGERKARSGDRRDPGGGSLRMCRPCSAAWRAPGPLWERSQAVSGQDEYDRHSLPSDLQDELHDPGGDGPHDAPSRAG